MKKHLLIGGFLMWQLMSCSKDFYFSKDIDVVSRELYYMKLSDQVLRSHETYLNKYFGINDFKFQIDSLTWMNKSSSIDSIISNNTMIRRIKNDNFTKSKKQDYNERKKSLQITTRYVDSINTLNLIRITKKYGFPSHERLQEELGLDVNVEMTSSPQLIFVHSPEFFFPEIRKLMIKEYTQGRMDKNACSRISWHLNGRKGNPFPKDYSHCKIDTLR